jgi:hypothetical protein
MKKLFQFISLLTVVLNANAQDGPVSINVNRATEWSKEQAKIDTSRFIKKTVSREINLSKALDVLIDMSGDLTVKTWNDNKVKIEATLKVDERNDMTDDQFLEMIGASVKEFGSTVRVKCRNSIYYTMTGSGSQTLALLTASTGTPYGVSKGERSVTLYIPSQSALEIENKYGHLAIQGNIKSLILNNTNGQIDADNIDRLQLRSKQGSFTAEVIGEADIFITHGRISLKELTRGSFTGSYNTIEIEKTGDLALGSNSDDIDIDNSGSVTGIKNYGSLRINTSGKLDLEGINSNIKLRNIAPAAGLIRIVNRNAELRLPIRDSKNYAIEVKGSFNRFYSSFTDKMTVDTLIAKEVNEIKAKYESILQASKSIASSNASGAPFSITGTTFSSVRDRPISTTSGFGVNQISVMPTLSEFGSSVNNNLRYTYKVGGGAGQIKFDVICTNCTLDLK